MEKKHEKSLVIHGGHGRLEIVHFGFVSGQLQLLNYDRKKISLTGVGTLKEGADFIREFLTKNSIREKNVIFNFSDSTAIVIKYLTLPLLPKEEIPQAIQWQLKEDVPFNLEDAPIEYEIVREYTEADGISKRGLLVAVANRDSIDQCVSMVSQCQLNVMRVTSSFLNYASFLRYVSSQPLVCAVLDMGEEESTISIFRDNKLNFVRRLPLSWDRFVHSLTQTLTSDKGKITISAETAEVILSNVGIPQDPNIVIDQRIQGIHVLSLMRPSLEVLVREIRFSFDYFKSLWDAQRPELVYLVGQAARLKNLEWYLNKEMNISVMPLPVPPSFKVSLPAQEKSEYDDQTLMTAIAASLTDGHTINLLPLEIKKEKVEYMKKNFLRASLFAAAVVCIALLFSASYQMYQEETKLRNLKVRHQSFHEMSLLRQKFVSLEDLIHKIQERSVPPDGILKVIGLVIPSEIVLDELSFDQMSNHLILKGTVLRAEISFESAITTFMEQLEGSSFFTEASLTSSQETGVVPRFEIKCTLVQ